MPRIVISRATYERMKDAALTGGILWESEGKVQFRNDGTVSLDIEDSTLARLNKVAPDDAEHAISVILDNYFYRRRVQ